MEKDQKLILQKKLGARLQQLREGQKLALRELSYRCNLDHSKIGKIEKGRMNITLNTLFELSDALQVHPRELFDFTFTEDFTKDLTKDFSEDGVAQV